MVTHRKRISRDRLSCDIDEELQSHIEAAIEQGRDPAEARRSFGFIDAIG
jgi:hypothetical protein